MTNREQIAWAISYSEYTDREVAEQIAKMIEAIGHYLGREDEKNLERWLGLECDPETNNWGVLKICGNCVKQEDCLDYESYVNYSEACEFFEEAPLL